ncbi:MAG: carboxypeptidase-like regulatory domain-containing protein [Proteobacteria bacterium]|nr:carboxypeptidase-like regulatory domain-containing protein [Pseudomonadota bacterium]
MNHFNKLSTFALLALTLSAGSACTSATPNEDNQLSHDGNSVEPIAVGSIQGRVMTLSGMPVVAADVEAGGDAGSTDSQGYFSLTHVAAGTDVDVIVQSERYSSGRIRIALAEHQEQSVLLTVAPADLEVLDDAAAGGTVVAPSGVEIIFPANSIVDAAGNPVSGPIEVKTALIDEYHEAAAAPGSSLEPGMAAGSELGMVEVELTQDGAPVELSSDVELRLPLEAGTAYVDGDVVDLRHFDEDLAVWTAEGSGLIDAGMFVASVGHFSWWWYGSYPGGSGPYGGSGPNYSHGTVDSSCICGKATTPAGTPLVDGTVKATGENYWGWGYSQVAPNGDFCITLMMNDPALPTPLTNTLQIWGPDANGDLFETVISGAQTGTSPTDCSLGTGGCEDLGTQTLNPTVFTCIQATLTGDWAPGLEIWWRAVYSSTWPWDESFSTYLAAPASGSICLSIPSAPTNLNGNRSIWNLGVETVYPPGGIGGPTGGEYRDEGFGSLIGNDAWGVLHDGTSGHCDQGTCMDVGILDITFCPN